LLVQLESVNVNGILKLALLVRCSIIAYSYLAARRHRCWLVNLIWHKTETLHIQVCQQQQTNCASRCRRHKAWRKRGSLDEL